MVTDEMMKRAIEAYAKDTGAEGFQLEGWIEPAIRAALEAALSAAEPRGYLIHDKDNPDGRYFKHKPSISDDDMSEYEIWIEPLYAAPPAPSVAVKEAGPVAWRCKDFAGGWILDHSERSAREYQSNTGCAIQPLYTTPPTISVAIENLSDEQIRRIADAKDVASCRSRIRSALSAQVQDVAGWRPIETAPKDESIIMLFRADEKHWASISTGYFKNDRFARNPKPYWGGPHERSLGIRWYRENPPTHWMPLPAAPAKQEGGND
jgi:hypothetical protein